MIEKVFVIVLCVIVAGAAVWGWWMENGSSRKNDTGEDAVKNSGEEKS
jgi:hypothetical protein